jgi:hypothetical protein
MAVAILNMDFPRALHDDIVAEPILRHDPVYSFAMDAQAANAREAVSFPCDV